MSSLRAPSDAHPISIAPMMDRTDRHFRWLLRRISRRALLYTEMVNTNAILHGDRAHHLDFDASEHPVSLQLGGDDLAGLEECARIAEDWGYDEVNINVGCPSSRVQSGSFGVVLMRRPDHVARAVERMRAVTSIPVTVKHRIGVDDDDSYEFMAHFVRTVAEAGADRFTVHARKAWLHGLSPKENRNIPPLRYPDVHRLKTELPHLAIEINGGLRTVDEYTEQLRHVDAVMIGRAAWDDPFHLAQVDSLFYGDPAPVTSRREVALALAERVDSVDEPALRVVRGALNLFAGVPGAKAWKQVLTEGCKKGAGTGQTVRDALSAAEAALEHAQAVGRV